MKKDDSLVKIALALSAASGMIYEVVATQILFFYFIRNSYSISLVLSIFLAGLGLGSLLMHSFIKRIKHKLLVFGIFQTIIGIYGFLVLSNIASLSFTLNTFGLFITSFIILFPPTLFLGASFPLAGNILGRKNKNIVGLVYSVDLAGAILGTLLAGFLLIPLFGNKISIHFAVIINFISAFLVLQKKSKVIKWFFVGIIFLLLLQMASLTHKGKISSSSSTFDFYKPSPYGEVWVEDKVLFIDGRWECDYLRHSESYWSKAAIDYSLQSFQNSKPKTLYIGLGCGITLEPFLQRINSSIDVVEINRVVVEATTKFSEFFPNTRINLIIDEGLNYLRSHTDKYDLIILGIENPGVIYSSDLYTQESFVIIKSSLSENGVFMLSIPPCNNELYYKIIESTLSDVFPYVYFVDSVDSEYNFIASNIPLQTQENFIISSTSQDEFVNTLDKKILSAVYLEKCKYW